MKHSELAQAVMIAVVLSVVVIASYALFGQSLLLRPFWMDEIHSWLLISDPDPIHALQSLQHGADYNPPVYYAVARFCGWLIPLTEYNLRILSVLATLSTMIGLALVFDRHMRMPASIGCSLLICSQGLVILQSTEARFYALWMALLTWFCFGLTTGKRNFLIVQLAILSGFAALVAGTHYFGIISIGLVCSAFIVVRRFEKAAVVRAGVPFLAAIVAVAFSLPLLSGQKAALTTATWVTPADLQRTTHYVLQFFPQVLLLVSFAIWLVGFFLKEPTLNEQPELSNHDSASPDLTQDNPVDLNENQKAEVSDDVVPPDALFVFGSLLLMPIVLIVFSLVVQPVLVNRYSVVACLWLVPVLTLLLRSTERRKSLLVFVAGCVMFAVAVRHGAATWDYNLKDNRELAAQLQQIPDGSVVLFEDRIDYWLLQHKDPHQTWYQLDFETPADGGVSNLKLVQRDVGRVIQNHYPNRFPLESISEFDQQDVFVVPYLGQQPIEAVNLSGRMMTQVSDRILKASLK